jgi:hypothetical protein
LKYKTLLDSVAAKDKQIKEMKDAVATLRAQVQQLRGAGDVGWENSSSNSKEPPPKNFLDYVGWYSRLMEEETGTFLASKFP